MKDGDPLSLHNRLKAFEADYPDEGGLLGRLVAFAGRMARNGAAEDTEALLVNLVYVAETLRGGNTSGSLDEDVQVLAENAESIAETLPSVPKWSTWALYT